MRYLYFSSIVSLFLFSCGGGSQTSKGEEQQENVTEEVVSTDSVENKVFFKNINDGDTISSPVVVEMGVEGMEVEPAGQKNAGKGHHHIIINNSYVTKGDVVAADSTHLHFGKGQTSTELDLDKGSYTLTLQFADGTHVSYGEEMSASVNVIVK